MDIVERIIEKAKSVPQAKYASGWVEGYRIRLVLTPAQGEWTLVAFCSGEGGLVQEKATYRSEEEGSQAFWELVNKYKLKFEE